MGAYSGQKAFLSFRNDIKDGGITLVLGSGVNTGLLDNWWGLYKKLYRDIYHEDLPCEHKQYNILAMLRGFEQFSYKKGGGFKRADGFSDHLSKLLYLNCKDYRPGHARTLDAIADVLIADALSVFPKIRRVVTFNVDSLLEDALLLKRENHRIEPHPITHYHQAASHFKGNIDIYHLHGFLPSEPFTNTSGYFKKGRENREDLVFGDDEYWEMTARPTSLPNVVMLNALHDSHCFFIGLSMDDPNIARWLALRTNEIRESKFRASGAHKDIDKLMNKHYWLDLASRSEKRAWLASRGVRSITIEQTAEFFDCIHDLFAGEIDESEKS